ncbi:hypothetical protein CRUP_010826 [Coryphaenoides rupestris]|nr:hypothetical protein CRUP_010826 [Coryphaenoides rupestris]
MLCFDGGGGEDGGEEEGSGIDSDSDFLGESMEEGPSSSETSPVGVSSLSPSPMTRLLQDGWRGLRGGVLPVSPSRGRSDVLLFEATDASVVVDGSAKYVRLHTTLRRNHGDQMHGVCFPRKKLRRNFTAETIARRSRAFEQYLSHLCSLDALRATPCVLLFFYLPDLQTGQLLVSPASTPRQQLRGQATPPGG